MGSLHVTPARNSAATAACEGATIVQTSTLEVNGKTITRNTFACPETAATKRTMFDRSPVRVYTRDGDNPPPIESACGEVGQLDFRLHPHGRLYHEIQLSMFISQKLWLAAFQPKRPLRPPFQTTVRSSSNPLTLYKISKVSSS